jgi:hypothetical protein
MKVLDLESGTGYLALLGAQTFGRGGSIVGEGQFEVVESPDDLVAWAS